MEQQFVTYLIEGISSWFDMSSRIPDTPDIGVKELSG
ncbi:hypothetical protein SAMN05216412_104284 [Nitrosospira multiformis]|uniref:Uncharacterized protein n=1 Tax=Nitrosospira multiformis TaxID=1231 RepID=A0A1I0D783_9PROT|nr:hypothetical protein SAMN05216412_104284 [Nitrosospira multiformis]